MPCSKNMCGKAEATAGDDSECEALGIRRGEATDHGTGYPSDVRHAKITTRFRIATDWRTPSRAMTQLRIVTSHMSPNALPTG